MSERHQHYRPGTLRRPGSTTSVRSPQAESDVCRATGAASARSSIATSASVVRGVCWLYCPVQCVGARRLVRLRHEKTWAAAFARTNARDGRSP